MDINNAIIAFTALAQETRLQVLKILLEYGSSGVAAGTISQRLDIPHNTLSFHLAHLSHAGLISSHKQGRSVIYSANCGTIAGLIAYLQENCCAMEEEGSRSECFKGNKT
jgi:ArsR family transcriptional regulator